MICECGNDDTITQDCNKCCEGNKCAYGCETCFCGCHDENSGDCMVEGCNEPSTTECNKCARNLCAECAEIGYECLTN